MSYNKDQARRYYLKNKERILKKRQQIKEKLNIKSSIYHNEHKEEIHKRQKEYRENNKEYFKQYREKNKEKLKEISRKNYIKRTYGLTYDEFKQLGDIQNWKCPICGIELFIDKGKYCIDHDHSTGVIRELLCNDCNLGLGNFTDSINKLTNAIRYLEKHNGKKTTS